MARYHESKKKRNVSMHDREMDRENLKGGRGGELMDRHAHKMQMLEDREFYAGAADKHRHEFEDHEMIYEDPRAIANLPQSVEIKTYPRINAYMPGDLDDGMSGIDAQMMENSHQTRKHLKPRKA
jgi:hypothetical protein